MLPKPYLIFLGDETSEAMAKTGFGIRDWAPETVIGQHRLGTCTVDLGVPELGFDEAVVRGAKALLIGVAPIGGHIPLSWIPVLRSALEAGLDLVSGLHDRLGDSAELKAAADSTGHSLHDVRHTDRAFTVATGRKRAGKRLLTVGTDCALGKKYTALAIARALKAKGVAADFRATGQTGIMISGEGVAIDAVISDFVAGAAESLSPDADAAHWDVIEGQGALFHPGFAAVTLGLIHGSQPDALVLCHDPERRHVNGYPDYPIPSIATAIGRYLDAARLTNPAAAMVGVSLNTSRTEPKTAAKLMEQIEAEHGLPCLDPMRCDLTPLVDRLAAI